MKNVWNKLAMLLAAMVILGLTAAAGCADGNESGHLINGSFELDNTGDSGQQITITSSYGYEYRIQDKIKAWKTTATDNQIELFKENTSTYISGVTIIPTEGQIAAELNATEESTLYQVVKTEPMSLYEWGLDHGSRSQSDTMALIIGPVQEHSPKKKDNNKNNKDQFMQMVYWLKDHNSSFSTFTNGVIANGGTAITLYSAKFDSNGGFQNLSQGQSPFSMTRDDTYSEAWSIWVMTDGKATSGTNPWTSYGKNRDGFESLPEAEKAKYRYIVPSGQTDTYFAFVSVKSADNRMSYGNFLDGCSFDLYRVFTGNTTPHGSAQVSGGTEDKRYSMSIDGKHVQYVANGAELTIEANVPVTDPLTVSFAGVYLKTKDGTRFIRNDSADQGTTHRWTSEEKEVEEPDGVKKKVIVYTHTPPADEKILVDSAISMYFVFVKSPDITYDANGGRLQEGDVDLYSFKPDTTNNPIAYIAPYTAHAAIGPASSFQADTDKSSWKFMGWKLTDDNDTAQALILPGTHTVVCNYVNTDNTVTKQPFVVLKGEQDLGDGIVTETGVTWPVPAGSKKLYDKEASGLTMIAQWTWRQAFAPMTLTETKNGRKYVLSDAGGTVSANKNENTQIDATSSATAKISKWYFGAEDETIEAEAKAKPGYAFEGWYDLDGQLIGKDPKITVTVRQREANSYYARFSLNYQQTFTREIKDEKGEWVEPEASLTTVPALSLYGQLATYGTTVSSNVAADTSDYRFIGWYTSVGNPVDRTMLRNNGRTIMYQVTGESAYIARFEPRQKNTWMLYYDANSTEASGITPAQEITTGNTATVQGNGFKREYYSFRGWTTTPEGIVDGQEETLYQKGEAYDNTAGAESVTLYAQWTENPKYKLTYNNNGGSGSMNEQIWYVGKNVTVQENGFTHDGYTFKGWNTQAKGGGTAYQPGKPYTMPEGGGTLYAQWIKNVKVTYDPNGGDGTAHTEHGYQGEEFTVKTAEDVKFILENHTFVGWNTQAGGKGAPYIVGSGHAMPQDDLTLYAQWAPNVKVTYHPNGSEGTTHAEFGYQGKEFTVKTAEALGFSREHYTFDGWKTEAGVEYKAGMNRPMPGTDLDLYAQWRENEKVWLRYDANGGTGSMPGRQAHSGEQVCLDKNAFTFVNSRFMGWNTQPDGTGTAYAEGDWITLQKEDVTVYAQWEVVRIDLPKTGDSSHPALWLALLSASSAALACFLSRSAKARKTRA